MAMPVTGLLVLATPMWGVGMFVVAARILIACALVLLSAHRVFR